MFGQQGVLNKELSYPSYMSQHGVVSVATRLRASWSEVSWFDSRQGRRFVSSQKCSLRLAPEHMQSSVRWVPEALYRGIKRPWHEADHLRTSSAEIKNEWSYTYTPYTLSWCAQWQITFCIHFFFAWWRAPQQMLRAHRCLKASCATRVMKMSSFFYQVLQIMEHQWNEIDRGKPTTRRKPCPSATLSTTNLTWTDPGSNPGLRCEMPATDRLSHGTAFCIHFVNSQWACHGLCVSHRLIDAEARIQCQVSLCGIYDVQNGTGSGFSLSISIFPCQYFTAALYSIFLSFLPWFIDWFIYSLIYPSIHPYVHPSIIDIM